MPSFEKSPPEVLARFGALAELVPGAVRKQMFGSPVCTLGGNMFMGVHNGDVFLRLGSDDREQLLAVPGTRLFEPMAGRPMKEYVVVPAELLASPDVEPWVERSFAYALTLPAKEPKPRGAKSRP